MFDEAKLYAANDDAVTKTIAPYSTMAHWRCESRGPAYVKIGPKVMYHGRALNEWLQSRTVEPRAA